MDDAAAFRYNHPAAFISGWDSFWYSIVTITTVGYGDRYPVTIGGRIIAMFIMFMGVGIIGALASILSSLLVGSPSAPAEEDKPVATTTPLIEQEITAIKNELAALRQLLEKFYRTVTNPRNNLLDPSGSEKRSQAS